jgi:serine-aspartate repeat-containing protein C/D/E
VTGSTTRASSGLAGITVTLLDADGNVLATTVTDADGKYLFTDLEPGEYTTKITVPPGYVASTAIEQDSALLATDGASDLTLDFGLYPALVSVGDFVWLDTDRDGIHDTGEPGLAGITVTLLDADGNVLATTVTDADGKYLFTGLEPGEYTTKITVPPGYVASTAIEQDSALLTTDGASDLTLDFGLYPVLVSVGDFVWLDTDRDGIHDTGELGLAGITVTLLDADGNVLATTVTDADGKYLFDGLEPGEYTTKITVPPGYVASTAIEQDSALLTTDGASGPHPRLRPVSGPGVGGRLRVARHRP